MNCPNCGVTRIADSDKCQCGFDFLIDTANNINLDKDLVIKEKIGKQNSESEEINQTSDDLITEDSAMSRVPDTIPVDAPDMPPSLQKNQNFPKHIPWILGWPTRRLRILGAIIGLVFGLATSVLFYIFTSEESMLGHMFDLSSEITVIPVAILCMFFWGCILCSLRLIRQRKIERISKRTLLLDATKILSETNPENLIKELNDQVIKTSPLLRRLQSVLRQWLILPNLQNADVVMEQHVANDEEEVRSGYNLIRTFVWALPVLGLIGTVIGISLAVGGFAQFLGGNVEDVAVIKKNLVGVTGGLSFAFLITLQGLLTSLLLMLAASALQTREEKFYTAIQQDITDIFLPVLQNVAPELRPASDTGELAIWRETLKRAADGVLDKIRNESNRLIKTTDEKQEFYQDQVSSWAKGLHQEMENVVGRIREAADNVGIALANAGEDFLNRLSLVREALDQQNTKLLLLFEAQENSTAQRHQDIIKTMSEQNLAIQTNVESIARLSETTKMALESQTALQTAIRQLSEANIDHTFTSFVQALSAQSQEIQTMGETVAKLTETTREVLGSQVALQTATRQLHEAEFGQTLAAFRDSLIAMGPILASFREPFVFQAIPVSGDARKKG